MRALRCPTLWFAAGALVVAACGAPNGDAPRPDAASTSSPAATTAGGATTTAPTPPVAPSPAPAPAPSPEPPTVVLAAGDIAWCGPDEDDTGALLAAEPDAAVLALGDLAYDAGTPEQYERCYLPAWGHAVDRTFPAPGNHDAVTPGLAGYFGVFGDRAGEAPAGYHAFELGDHWLGVALNSNCTQAAPCTDDGAQVAWLRDVLAGAGDRHVLAIWHHPRFSSGHYGDDPRTAAFWEVLHDAGAELVLSGHEHDYERFTPLDPAGEPDEDGIREFVVGTGGAVLRDFTAPQPSTSELRDRSHHGVLRLELRACGYAWRFLATDGSVPDEGDHELC